MSDLLQTGAEVDVSVVAVKPFGCFVTTSDGVAGLVRGANAAVGDVIRVRIVEFDQSQQRFSGVAA